MAIATDNDGVLVDFVTPFLIFHNRKYRTNLEYHDVFSQDLWTVLHCSPEESDARLDEFVASPHFGDLLPMEGAVEALHRITANKEVHVITARPLDYKPKTLQFFNQYFPQFKSVRFCEEFPRHPEFPKRTRKAQFCEQFRPEFLIEDHAKNARECAPYCGRVIIFNHPWNINEYTPENGIRVNNWAEALDILN